MRIVLNTIKQLSRHEKTGCQKHHFHFFFFILLVALVKATVLPVLNLGEVNVEVLEIFKEDEPMFVNKGQEISIKHE